MQTGHRNLPLPLLVVVLVAAMNVGHLWSSLALNVGAVPLVQVLMRTAPARQPPWPMEAWSPCEEYPRRCRAAETWLERAQGTAARDRRVQWQHGLAYLTAGDAAAAEAVWTQMDGDAFRTRLARLWLGYLAAHRGDQETAVQWWRSGKTAPFLVADAYYWHYFRDDVATAEWYVQQAAAVDPAPTAETRYIFAWIYENKAEDALTAGRVDEAIAAYRQALVHTPEPSGIYVKLGQVYERAGLPDRARAAYGAAIAGARSQPTEAARRAADLAPAEAELLR